MSHEPLTISNGLITPQHEFKKMLFKKLWVKNANFLFLLGQQKCNFLIFQVFFGHCWNHYFSPSFHVFFVVSAGPRPTQPNLGPTNSSTNPAQPELEQPIHGNILGHSATVGVFVAIEFSLCDVFLKLLVTRSRTWQRKWHGRGTECTKTRRHGPNRTEQEPGRPQTDAKKVYWKPFPGASKTGVF